MSFKFIKLVVDWDGAKYNNRLEIGDESTSPDTATPVDIRFKVPGYIENVHTIFFQNYSSGTNVPRIYGDATNLVFYDNHDATNQAGVKLADLVSGAGANFLRTDGSNGMTGDLTLSPGHNILGVKVIDGALGTAGTGDNFDIRGSNNGGTTMIPFLNWDYTTELLSISHLAAGTTSDDAVNYGQLVDYLPLSAGSGKALTGDLHMGGNKIVNLPIIKAADAGEGYDVLYIRSQSGALDIAIFQASSDDSSGILDMRNHHITDLAPADSYGHAVEYSQLGGLWTAGDILYAKDSHTLMSLPSSGAATKVLTMNAGETAPEWVVGGGDYVHPDARQCTTGTWAWSAISNIPSTLEYTTNKNIANGYCGIGSDGYMPTIALLPSMIKGSLYVANNLNTMAELLVGTTDGHVLTVNNSKTLGVEWAAQTGGAGLWESSTAGETYLTTPEPVNLKGQPLRGSNASGGDLLLVANSVDSGIIYCQDTLNVQGNDINGASVIQANTVDGIDCHYSGGTNMMYIATASYSFIANANASMNTHNIINVGTIKGTTSTPLHLDFCGDTAHEIWRVGDDLTFKDVHAGTKTLSELAAGGGSSTFVGLSDTPTDYTGAAGKYVKVNSVPDGLEFTDIDSTYWEAVDATTIRPIGHNTIQGIDANDLYIKPASGQTLYLG